MSKTTRSRRKRPLKKGGRKFPDVTCGCCGGRLRGMEKRWCADCARDRRCMCCQVPHMAVRHRGGWCPPCEGAALRCSELADKDQLRPAGQAARVELYAARAGLGLPLFAEGRAS